MYNMVIYLFFEVAWRAFEINSKIFTAVLGPHLLRCLKNSPFIVVTLLLCYDHIICLRNSEIEIKIQRVITIPNSSGANVKQ